MVLSSGALISSVAASSAWPNPSRAPQRLMLAAQSRASTLVPSWNIRSGRSVMRQVLPSVLADRAFGHLRLRRELAVEAEQRVEHQEAVVARLVGGGPDRIEHREVGLRHELQHLASLATRDGGRGEGGSVEARKVRRRMIASGRLRRGV